MTFPIKTSDGYTANPVVLVDPITGEPYVASGGGGGGGGSDREFVVTNYRVTNAFAGASVGDVVVSITVIDVSTATPVVGQTIWRNQTALTTLGSAPSAANLELLGQNALTDAQLRASAVVTAPNFTRGVGNADANTLRATLASDGPAVLALQAIDADIGSPTTGAAPADGTGDYTVLGALKRVLLNGASLLARIPAAVTGVANHNQAAQPVRMVPQNVWTAGYSQVGASVLDSVFNPPYVTAGSGLTFNQAGGSLNVVAGTTANAEFLARSIESFRGSMRLRFSIIASQRIANNNFGVLLADLVGENLTYTINSATSVTVNVPNHGFPADGTMVGQFLFLAAIANTVGAIPGRYAIASIPDANNINFTVAGWPATGSGTLTLFGRNYVRNLLTGTVVTNINVDAQRNGWATGDTVATINTTASPGTLIATELTGRDIFWQDSLRATSTQPNFTTRASRYENIPDQTVPLFVFLWNFNGSTAPASSTTFTLGQTVVESFPNNSMYLQGIRAQGVQNALPVVFANASQTVGIGTALPAGANLIGGVNLAQVVGAAPAAEDAAAGTTPLLVGGVVAAARAPATLINGDAARARFTTEGSLLVQPGVSVPLIEVTSAARTTGGNSGVISVPTGGSLSGLINVTAVSGTPTLDLTLEESYDNGTTFTQIWAANRMTAIGTQAIPPMGAGGLRRWVWAIAGGTPSVTFSITVNALPNPYPLLRNLFDRVIAPNTLNSASASLYIENCPNLTLVVTSGAGATTNPVYGIRVSEDNVTWADSGLSLTVPPNQTVLASIANINAKFAQIYIRTAGIAATHTIASLRARS